MTDGRSGSGHDSRRYCGARKRQGEGDCKRPAGWGTDHPGEGQCKLHGGSTHGRTAAAHIRQAEREAAAELARLDVAPVADPLTELAKLAGQVIAWRDSMADQVNKLTTLGYENDKTGEQLRTDVALFERAMDRCISVLGTMARLKIDERLVNIEKARVDFVADALAATLTELELDPDARQRAIDGLVRRLRLAAG